MNCQEKIAAGNFLHQLSSRVSDFRDRIGQETETFLDKHVVNPEPVPPDRWESPAEGKVRDYYGNHENLLSEIAKARAYAQEHNIPIDPANVYRPVPVYEYDQIPIGANYRVPISQLGASADRPESRRFFDSPILSGNLTAPGSANPFQPMEHGAVSVPKTNKRLPNVAELLDFNGFSDLKDDKTVTTGVPFHPFAETDNKKKLRAMIQTKMAPTVELPLSSKERLRHEMDHAWTLPEAKYSPHWARTEGNAVLGKLVDDWRNSEMPGKLVDDWRNSEMPGGDYIKRKGTSGLDQTEGYFTNPVTIREVHPAMGHIQSNLYKTTGRRIESPHEYDKWVRQFDKNPALINKQPGDARRFLYNRQQAESELKKQIDNFYRKYTPAHVNNTRGNTPMTSTKKLAAAFSLRPH
jgi:hypothetical protein